MAIVIFSDMIGRIVGRSQGTVYQNGKYGTIRRTEGFHTKSSANNISRTKSNLAEMQAAWRNLSSQDRQLWEVYAQFRNRPTRKIKGNTLGGQATFILENSIRMQFVQNFGVLSQTILTTPVISPPPQTVTIESIINAGGSLTMGTDYIIPDNTKFLFLYITRPLLLSQLSVWNKKKLIANISATGQSHGITSQYENLYGSIPAVGQAVNTEIFLYDKDISTFGAGNSQRIIIP